jgi:AraC-like DNA-binding protein
MRQPTVSGGLFSGLLRFAEQQGFDVTKLLNLTGINPLDLEDPDNRLPFSAYVHLMREAENMSDDAAFALHYAETISMSEISIVGLLMEASETIGAAYMQMQRYGALAMETDAISDGPRFEMAMENNRLFLVDRQLQSLEFPELTESAFTWLICGSRRYMKRAPVLSVQFTWEAPSYYQEYERIFQCPVEYGAKWNALEMHPEALSWPVAQNPEYVFGMLTDRAEELLAKLETTHTTSGQLQALLAPILHQGDITADMAATRMGYSRQTLFRRLKEEGTSYTELVDTLRYQMAIEYLKVPKTSINETAYLVGFSEPAAFSRAFKRWTGETPAKFRQKIRAHNSGSAS